MRTGMVRDIICGMALLLAATGSSASAVLDDPKLKCLQAGREALPAEAIDVCTKALREQHSAEEGSLFLLNRGMGYAGSFRPELALKDFNQAVELNPGLAEAYLERGMLFLHTGDYEQATVEFQQAKERKPSLQAPDTMLQRIRTGAELRDRNFAEAERAAQQGNYKAAVQLYTELLEKDALAGARYPLFVTLYNRGNAFFAQHQVQEAIQDYSAAIELNPKHVSSYYNRAGAYATLGRFDLGVRDYNKVIELDPNNAAAYYNRGAAKAGLRYYQGAIRDYQKALELQPGWGKAEQSLREVQTIAGVYRRFQDGLDAEKRRDYDQAIAIFNEVLASGRLDARNSATIYYSRARVYARRKQYPEVVRDLKRAIELYPEWPALHKTLEAVEDERKKLEEEQGGEDAVAALFQTLLASGQPETAENSPAVVEQPAAPADAGPQAQEAVVAREGGEKARPDAASSMSEEPADAKEAATSAEASTSEAAIAQVIASQAAAAEQAQNEKRRAEENAALLKKYPPGSFFNDCPDCPELAVIPPGSYQMGDPDPAGREVEHPVHAVKIEQPFAVSRYEITFAQWDACEAAGGCGYHPDDAGAGRGKQPVYGVNWEDANAYVRWLSEKTGQQYRLLSEAEWEYVASAGIGKAGHWEKMDDFCKYANGADQMLREKDPRVPAIACRDGYVKTAPVGSFPANAYGLFDLYGNIAEWVSDCWNANYKGAPADGAAWESGDCDRHVLRGGSWRSGQGDLRPAFRTPLWTELRINTTGFRVARTLHLPQPAPGKPRKKSE
jgi:formylglycine-generating enzyme required for sulfatase activity/tetratricopeptide (TPR) repeat protein